MQAIDRADAISTTGKFQPRMASEGVSSW